MRHRFALALVPAATLLLTPVAFAQESTPEGEEAPEIGTCQGEARPVDEIVAMVESGGAMASPAAGSRQLGAPLGQRADVDTRLAIEDTLRELYACLNANDIPRAASLMTDAGLARFLGTPEDPSAIEALRENLSAEPQPRAEGDDARIVAITDESLLEDGRAVAFVVVNEPILPPGGAETLAFFFREQDGSWLLDDYIDFSLTPAEELTGGTPEAGA